MRRPALPLWHAGPGPGQLCQWCHFHCHWQSGAAVTVAPAPGAGLPLDPDSESELEIPPGARVLGGFSQSRAAQSRRRPRRRGASQHLALAGPWRCQCPWLAVSWSGASLLAAPGPTSR